jgi:hypothetical protein
MDIQLSEENSANNKALIKVYVISFAIIIIFIISLLVLYITNKAPIEDTTAPRIPAQAPIGLNDNVVENITLSTSQERDLNNQLEQSRLNNIELQNQLVDITEKYESLVNSFEQADANNFESDQSEQIQLSQIVTLTTALSMANQRITDLENELRNSSAEISQMQTTIDELNETIPLIDENDDERIQLLTIIDEKDDLINQLQEAVRFLDSELEVSRE